MEKPSRFSEYLFAKMAPACGPEAGEGAQLPRNTTVDSSAPRELTGIQKWLSENMLLMVTLSGVLLGIISDKNVSAASTLKIELIFAVVKTARTCTKHENNKTSDTVSFEVEGLALRQYELSPDTVMLIAYPGELFMRVLKLMILPLVIASLIAGSASLNARMNGRIALRTLIYFFLTSLFNAILGVTLAVAIHPGNPGLKTTLGEGTESRQVNLLDSLLDLGRNLFPDNIFQAAFQQAHTVYVPKKSLFHNESVNETVTIVSTADVTLPIIDNMMIREIHYRAGTNTLGIVFFCLAFGTILGTLGLKGKVVIDFFTAIFEVIMRMVSGVMWLTPVGISSVIAGKILAVDDLGLVMSQLAWFIATVIFGVFFYQFIVMQLIYFVFIGKNPFKFYMKLVQPMLTAFATASTAAALPMTFQCANDKCKIDTRITRFVLPIGCNINMDGTALFIAVASCFIAQMNGIYLGFGELITVCLCSTAASMSSASVPSAALVLLLMVLTAIEAPAQDVSLLFAVDWLVDRFRTTNNMLGDCYAAAVVEHLSKKELMACDAAAYQVSNEHTPVTSNGHILSRHQPDIEANGKVLDTNSVIIDLCHGKKNILIKK